MCIRDSAWRCGGTMIIYLAALRSVPASLYEAAELDGANGIKKFFHIIWQKVLLWECSVV